MRSNRKVRSCSICVSLRHHKIAVMHADIVTFIGHLTLTETVIVLLLSIILLGLFDLVVLLMAMLFLIVFKLRWHSLVRRKFSFLSCFVFIIFLASNWHNCQKWKHVTSCRKYGVMKAFHKYAWYVKTEFHWSCSSFAEINLCGSTMRWKYVVWMFS